MLTYKYAMKIIKAQLAKTPQNVEIFAKMDGLVDRFGAIDEEYRERFGTQAAHLLNHMQKIYKKDKKELKKFEEGK